MYFQGGQPVLSESVQELERMIVELPALFQRYSEAELKRRPSPGKWSKKEILGHLVDSAINNLKRFTEIQFLPSPYQLRFYQQDALVKVNRYQDLPLDHILALWKALNQQVLYVIQSLEADQLQLEWQVKAAADRQKFDLLIADYVAHLAHHVRQISP